MKICNNSLTVKAEVGLRIEEVSFIVVRSDDQLIDERGFAHCNGQRKKQ